MSAGTRVAGYAAALVAALLVSQPARADLDATLDVALQATRTRAWLGASGATPPSDLWGVGGRLGATRGGLRFGGGVGLEASRDADGIAASNGGARRWLGSTEAYFAYAPGSYWSVRPLVELRAHVERVGPSMGSARWSAGFGPRIGVIVALSEYFFFEVAVGRDLVGPQEERVTVALGLPIPLSHL